jgi:hypothetical protein
MDNLKQYILEIFHSKLDESKYDTTFKKIEYLHNYDIENVKVSGNRISLELEDSDFNEVSLNYTLKKTPMGIVIEGEWSRETSSNNMRRDDFGKTTKATVKSIDDVVKMFSKALNRNDVNKLKSLKV